METKRLVVYAVLTLAVVATAGRAAEGPEPEIAKLRAKVKELQDDNQALRAEIVRLKDKLANGPIAKADQARLNADLRRLADLYSDLFARPNAEVRKDAAALAVRLAPDLPGNGLIWGGLFKTGILKDGISLADATKLLGQPTEKRVMGLVWYFPTGRHVNPCLYATVTQEGLRDWKLTLR